MALGHSSCFAVFLQGLHKLPGQQADPDPAELPGRERQNRHHLHHHADHAGRDAEHPAGQSHPTRWL